MTLRWLLASLHLLGLGIAMGSVFARGVAFRHITRNGAVKRILLADNFWGISALILISTGLLRAFAGFEKGTGYYVANTYFWIKMGLLAVVLALEIQPMIHLIRWRLGQPGKEPIDTSLASRFGAISYIQTILVTGMLLAATAMARGLDL